MLKFLPFQRLEHTHISNNIKLEFCLAMYFNLMLGSSNMIFYNLIWGRDFDGKCKINTGFRKGGLVGSLVTMIF